MKYFHFTTPSKLKQIRKNGIQGESVAVIPWAGSPDEKWNGLKKYFRWLRNGSNVGVVIDDKDLEYPLESYIRFSSGEVGLRFYKSLESNPIEGITLDEDSYEHAVKTSKGGWRSSLRVLVGSDRTMGDLVSRVGVNGGIEVVVDGGLNSVGLVYLPSVC